MTCDPKNQADLSRRALLLATPAAALVATAPAQAQVPGSLSGAERTQALNGLVSALNRIGRLQGRFIQTNPDRTNVAGQFWMARPGKVRFEYDAPSPLLLVSNGELVALQDRRLRTTDRYPLRSTPLYFLLKPNVSLDRDVLVGDVRRLDGNLIAALRDRRREADGELTVVFDERAGRLEEWAIRDRQGRVTRVRLTETSVPAAIAERLFVIAPTPRGFDPKAPR